MEEISLILLKKKREQKDIVYFICEGETKKFIDNTKVIQQFKGEKKKVWYVPTKDGEAALLVGAGKKEKLNEHLAMELMALAVKEMEQREIKFYDIDISNMLHTLSITSINPMVLGAYLGTYKIPKLKGKKEETTEKDIKQTAEEAAEKESSMNQKQINSDNWKFCIEKDSYEIGLIGVLEKDWNEAEQRLKEAENLAEGVIFARDMVNLPGNHLRPIEFAAKIREFVKTTNISVEVLDFKQIKELGMNGLAGVGGSSGFEPCFVILRYEGDTSSKERIGLVGKGVTLDTGGYCLKPAGSMLGIKGDMAGGAAVVGAIYALAKNEIKSNVTGIIPICENRISDSSLVPGDVITSYLGKTIEVCNTDAEGRLILADAVAYAVKEENVTKVLDIATLTGAVVSMFGFTITGILVDDEIFYQEIDRAYQKSLEKYCRIVFGEEHEEMIKSTIADIKNVGESVCGTITAGLFIREFAEKFPWAHLDIAGTAWVDSPKYSYQEKGATGAGVTTLYYLLKKE